MKISEISDQQLARAIMAALALIDYDLWKGMKWLEDPEHSPMQEAVDAAREELEKPE